MVLSGVLCITILALSSFWGLERPWSRVSQGEDTMKGDLEPWPVGAELKDSRSPLPWATLLEAALDAAFTFMFMPEKEGEQGGREYLGARHLNAECGGLGQGSRD